MSIKMNLRVFWLFSIILILITTTFPTIIGSDIGTDVISNGDHLTTAIWGYSSDLNRPEKAVVVNIEHHQWEALTAVCMTPVCFSRSSTIPLIFDDGTEKRTIEIPHDMKNINEFGPDAISASAKIATDYWNTAELVFVVNSYEESLWIVPSASFLSAPILVTPTKSTIAKLNTKCLVLVGGVKTELKTENVITLSSKEDVWKFQIELLESKGTECNYVIITNPSDTDDNLNENIKWPFISLTAAPLAAYRKALIQTGDYTANKELLGEFNKATGRIDQIYAQAQPYFHKVKKDSYDIEKFMMDNGHIPEFISIVGGAYAVPDYYFDIHTKYKYWDQILDYVPSMSPYANLSNIYPTNTSVKEDLGVGRIVGHSILDVTLMLMRTFQYNEFLAGGKYSNLVESNWEDRVGLVDGHRLNQPRKGGPPNGTSTEPYYPGDEILKIQTDKDFENRYYLPRNDSDPNDNNPTVNLILEELEKTSLIQFLAHGGSMINAKSIWLEGGYDPYDPSGEEKRLYLTSKEIMTRNFAPSLFYFIACHTGHLYLDQDMEDYFPLAFSHSGSVTFIGPVTCQSICFWFKAPYGPAATQAIYFWDNILNYEMTVGEALAQAKWDSYQKWVIDLPDDQRIEPDGPAFHIFGDPAFKPYIPNSTSKEQRSLDVKLKIIKSTTNKDEMVLEVSVKDLETGTIIQDAEIKTVFQGVEKIGDSAIFSIPKDEGDYPFKVIVTKTGYTQITASSWVEIKTEPKSDGAKGFIPNFNIVIFIFAVIISVSIIADLKRRRYRDF